MWAAALGLLAALAEPPLAAHEGGPRLEAAIVATESRGNTLARSGRGAVGLWQVLPAWTRVPGPWLTVPAVGRGEGRRIYRRWRARCERIAKRAGVADTSHRLHRAAGPDTGVLRGPDKPATEPPGRGRVTRCALRAYACGNKGLRGTHCGWHAAAVLGRIR